MNTDWAVYYGYSMGWATVRKMSDKRAYGLFDKFADRMWKRRGKSVLQYEKNIKRVVPNASPAELRDLSRYCMRSYARYWCDAFRMPDWPEERIGALPTVGFENIKNAYDNSPVSPIMVVPHAGNYDLGAANMAYHFGSVTTVAERLKPEKLFDKFVAFRAARNVEIIAAGTPGTVETLAERARAKTIVGIVGERDLSKNGVPITFFGEEARFPVGAAVLAHRLNVDIVPVSFWYEGRQAHAEIFPPVKISQDPDPEKAIIATTQAWADQIAKGIAAHPGDWHMLQPMWTADLDPSRMSYKQDPATSQAAQKRNGSE